MNPSRDRGWAVPRRFPEEPTWQLRGSCTQTAPELFFPEDAGRPGLKAREERAKRICLDCPVLTACRSHALASRETHGVWGAMSARDRARVFSATAEP
jgi:WhiB family redox-sensing transcriptional regulator